MGRNNRVISNDFAKEKDLEQFLKEEGEYIGCMILQDAKEVRALIIALQKKEGVIPSPLYEKLHQKSLFSLRKALFNMGVDTMLADNPEYLIYINEDGHAWKVPNKTDMN